MGTGTGSGNGQVSVANSQSSTSRASTPTTTIRKSIPTANQFWSDTCFIKRRSSIVSIPQSCSVESFVHKKGKGAILRPRTRMDVMPWNKFELGAESTIEDFSSWQGMDLIVDFYKFRNGDELAKRDIDATHLKAYEFLLDQWSQENKNDEQLLLKQFASIFKKQMVGEPSENFSVNMRTGELSPY